MVVSKEPKGSSVERESFATSESKDKTNGGSGELLDLMDEDIDND